MGGSSGSSQPPFNPGLLNAAMPSVTGGPYNLEGSQQNIATLQQKYPWITPPAGAFAGATPGTGQNQGPQGFNRLLEQLSIGGNRGISPTAPPAPMPTTMPLLNPVTTATNQRNPMQPNTVASILAALQGGG